MSTTTETRTITSDDLAEVLAAAKDAAHIARMDDHTVAIVGDTIYVYNARTNWGAAHDVPNYGVGLSELAERPGFRAKYGRLPDGDWVHSLYDRDDAGFGYAYNLTDSEMSEWGFIPL